MSGRSPQRTAIPFSGLLAFSAGFG